MEADVPKTSSQTEEPCADSARDFSPSRNAPEPDGLGTPGSPSNHGAPAPRPRRVHRRTLPGRYRKSSRRIEARIKPCADPAEIAKRAGEEIAANFPGLPLRERRRIVTALRHKLIPPGKPGRKRSKEITEAYADWKSGMRGLALYRKHIPRFDRMGIWERKVKTRALMDAIRSRRRREQRRRTREADARPAGQVSK